LQTALDLEGTASITADLQAINRDRGLGTYLRHLVCNGIHTIEEYMFAEEITTSDISVSNTNVCCCRAHG
jgi:hypothetical protein